MPDGFGIEMDTPAAGIVVLRFSGEIDLAAQPDLDAVLLAAENVATRGLIIDLSGVGFMDSTGIQALVRAHRAMEARGVSFVLAAAHPSHRTLEAAGLLGFFSFAATAESALRAFDGDRNRGELSERPMA